MVKPTRITFAVNRRSKVTNCWLGYGPKKTTTIYMEYHSFDEILASRRIQTAGLVRDDPIWYFHTWQSPKEQWTHSRITRRFRGPLQPDQQMKFKDALALLETWVRMLQTREEG